MGSTLSAVCFGILGALVARHVRSDALVVSAGVVGGLVFGKVLAAVLGRAIASSSATARSEPGGVGRALSDGVVVLVPFTVLALLAELYLGWSAVQSFASAGIMAASAGSGAAAARAGGGGWRTVVLPMVGGMVLSAAWMMAAMAAMVLLKAAGPG